MKDLLKPLKAESLTEMFIGRFEGLILSGKLAIGQKLPTERELAMQLGVGRQVVHEGLLHLSVRGLITMKPRAGAVVNDYRKEGSLALLQSFVNFQGGKLDRKLLKDLVELRTLVEAETARLAALNRTWENLRAFHEILKLEEATDRENAEKVAVVNFSFHHQVALATGNMVYPLLINSTKHLIENPIGRFYDNPEAVAEVFALHKETVRAIEAGEPGTAMSFMKRVLRKGFAPFDDASVEHTGSMESAPAKARRK